MAGFNEGAGVETDLQPQTDAAGLPGLEAVPLEQVADDSAGYLDQWHQLVSRTNWEKGKIICQWRDRVSQRFPEIQSVSDAAWSQLIGGVSVEHVGRLRRTYARFGDVYQDYENLSWSHFMAATAWEDAEMWLEGAVQSGWTVDTMRRQRWESLGAVPEQRPATGDIVVEEIAGDDLDRPVSKHDGQVIEGPILEGPDWGEPDERPASATTLLDATAIEELLDAAPESFATAYRELLEAIHQCQQAGWQTIRKRDVLKLMGYLKQQVRSETAAAR